MKSTQAILAVLLVLMFAGPLILLTPYNQGLLALVATYAVASLAQNLLSGYSDIPSLGNVAFFATGAYVAGSLISLDHAPVIVAALLGVTAAGSLGLVVGLPALRISGMHLAIVSIALVFVAQELMGQWDQNNGTSGVSVGGPGWLLQERGLYLFAAAITAMSYLAIWNLLRSRSGRALRALSDNPHAAMAVGIDTVRYRLAAFVLSGALTGLAGVVYLYFAHTVTPGAFTLDLSLAFLTMVILGGSGSLLGSLSGAALIGLLPSFLTLFPSEVGHVNLQQSVGAIYALLLLLCLRLFPEGVYPGVEARIRLWASLARGRPIGREE